MGAINRRLRSGRILLLMNIIGPRLADQSAVRAINRRLRFGRSILLMNIIVALYALQYTPHIGPAETVLHHVQPSHAREKLWLSR